MESHENQVSSDPPRHARFAAETLHANGESAVIPTRPGISKVRVTLFLLVGLCIAGWIIHRVQRPSRSSSVQSGRGQSNAVPVVAGTVQTQNVPIYLDGLGTVQAFNTVTVRSRVDGQILKVAFTE